MIGENTVDYDSKGGLIMFERNVMMTNAWQRSDNGAWKPVEAAVVAAGDRRRGGRCSNTITYHNYN